MAVPRKLQVRTTVKNGKLQEHSDVIAQAVASHEGKLINVTIERYYKKRSNKQNRYYWGVIIEHWKNILREQWGEVLTAKEVHSFLKTNLNFEEYVDPDTGEILTNPMTKGAIRKPKSTTENTTITQEDYHKSCRDLAWEMFEYPIPKPKKDLTKAIDVNF
jgi:hypothetical protein